MRYGAFGLVEVLGSSNAILVIDQMLKTSEVAFRTWNTKCGGHTTVFLSGDVAAVTAAVDSVKGNPPCEIIAAAVISNPSEEAVRLVEEEAQNTHLQNKCRKKEAGESFCPLRSSFPAVSFFITDGMIKVYEWIRVPVFPWIPSLAFSRSVIMAVRPDPEEAKSIAA